MKLKKITLGPRGRRVLKAVGMFLTTIACMSLICVVLLAVAGFGLYSYIFSRFEPTTTTVSKENIAISENAPKTNLRHIAVFGIDNEDGLVGRADTIMIFTVDEEHKQLKLTSILRDSFVSVKGHDQDKINHAFAYGGAELMLHTINSNFDMDISEYVALDYQDVVTIVDMVGGVDLNITDAERILINSGAPRLDPTSPTLSGSGNMHLNGAQAVTYARIRYIDNEIQRTARQRYLIQQLAYKLKNQHLTDYPKLMRDFLPLMETSLSEGELLDLAIDVLDCDMNIKQYTVPNDADEPLGGSYNGYWCWRYDIPAATERWHDFLETKVE